MMAGSRSGVVAAAVIAVAIGVGALVAYDAAVPRPASEPPEYGLVPAFTLVDAQGRPFTRETLRGRVWVVDFIFTRCAGQCPLMTQRMAAAARALEDEPAVGFLSITVDPSHDTPAILSAYAQASAAEDARWHFVTGEPSAVTRLTQDGFHLVLADGGPPEEPITHSVRLILIDQEARIRGYYDATDEGGVRRLVDDARRLLKRRS